MLVSSRLRDSLPWFQVHREGLLELRKFRNKRLRIIFNIVPSSSKKFQSASEHTFMQKFNSVFVHEKDKQQILQQNDKQKDKQTLCELYVSSTFKQLSDDRVIIFLNCYQYSQHSHLMVIGYLAASVFLYHQHENIQQEGDLTHLLADMKKMLNDTDVQKLEQQIKYKSGCTKKPYFLCIFDQQNKNQTNYHQFFRQYFKYREQQTLINEAVDALIDYFPQRSAINIFDSDPNRKEQKIKNLGQEYFSNILGRQIFNFQITGSSLQNLCFETCQIFNNNHNKTSSPSLDLSKIYSKIITNQKCQVEDCCIQKYTSLVTQLARCLPYEPAILSSSHCRIRQFIINQSMADASNCMIFNEYLILHANICKIMDKRYKQLEQNNKEMLRNRALLAYQNVQESAQIQQMLEQGGAESFVQAVQVIQQKICGFVQETVQDGYVKDLLQRVVNMYMEILGENVNGCFEGRDNELKELRQKVTKMQIEYKVIEAKNKNMESQFLYLNSINNQYKQKLLQYSQFQNGSDIADASMLGLKKKIMDLQMQLCQKNQVIQELGNILDKFQVDFNKKYFKPKFNKEMQSLLSQISNKVNDVYSLLSQLKKTEQFYKNIQIQFDRKKSQFNTERASQKTQIAELNQKLSQSSKQKTYLQNILQQSRQTIKIMQIVSTDNKQTINQLQNGCSRIKCILGETEGEFQKYKKALSLVATYCVTGKNDKLKDFIKVSAEDELKQILRPIVKK